MKLNTVNTERTHPTSFSLPQSIQDALTEAKNRTGQPKSNIVRHLLSPRKIREFVEGLE